jgi:hypothetical protein
MSRKRRDRSETRSQRQKQNAQSEIQIKPTATNISPMSIKTQGNNMKIELCYQSTLEEAIRYQHDEPNIRYSNKTIIY